MKHWPWASLSVLWTAFTDWFFPVDAGRLEWASVNHLSTVNSWLLDPHYHHIIDHGCKGQKLPINPTRAWSVWQPCVNHQQMVDGWLSYWSWMLIDTCGQHHKIRRLVCQPSTDGHVIAKCFSTANGCSWIAINFTILSVTSVQVCGDTP